jgi:L-fucose mutarotase
VLIADGDYPVFTTAGKNARIVHLNLSAGIVNCTQVLEALLSTILIEAAEVMDVPAGQSEPEIWNLFRDMFQKSEVCAPLIKLSRYEFYDEVKKDHTALVIQTGDLREYANLLITIGSL